MSGAAGGLPICEDPVQVLIKTCINEKNYCCYSSIDAQYVTRNRGGSSKLSASCYKISADIDCVRIMSSQDSLTTYSFAKTSFFVQVSFLRIYETATPYFPILPNMSCPSAFVSIVLNLSPLPSPVSALIYAVSLLSVNSLRSASLKMSAPSPGS